MSGAPTLDRIHSRRGFLRGLAGILAAGVAPAAIGSNILMPVKKLWTPTETTVAELYESFGSTLLMSLSVENQYGEKVWEQTFNPPKIIQPGEAIIGAWPPLTTNDKISMEIKW